MTLTPVHRRAIFSLCLACASPATLAGTAAANVCGTRSPTFERLGADYPLFDREPAAVADDRERPGHPPGAHRGRGATDAPPLARLLETLRTASLEGIDGERTRCLGDGAERRAIRWRFDLEQLERVERLDGRTVLTAYEARRPVRDGSDRRTSGDDRRVDGALVAEVVDVPHPRSWRADARGTSLESTRRFRRAGAASATCAATSRAELFAEALLRDVRFPRCSLLGEIETRVRAAGRAVEIEQTLYVNGRLSERVRWRIGS